jgi:hypothetical protein
VYSNNNVIRQELRMLQADFQLSADIEPEQGLPELSTLVLPQNFLVESSGGRVNKRKRGLKRMARRARDDEEEDDFFDLHFTEYMYQKFYEHIAQDKVFFLNLFLQLSTILIHQEWWVYESYLKRNLENNYNNLSPYEKESNIDDLPRCSVLSIGKQKMYLKLKHYFSKQNNLENVKFKQFLVDIAHLSSATLVSNIFYRL